jgi:hypothetical protein
MWNQSYLELLLHLNTWKIIKYGAQLLNLLGIIVSTNPNLHMC